MKTVALVLALFTVSGDHIGMMVLPGMYTAAECAVIHKQMARDYEAGLGVDDAHLTRLRAVPVCLDGGEVPQ